MRSKPHTDINSVSPTFVRAVATKLGPPHNFVESAEATFANLPSLDSDPDARAVIGRLEEARDKLIEEVEKDEADHTNGTDSIPS